MEAGRASRRLASCAKRVSVHPSISSHKDFDSVFRYKEWLHHWRRLLTQIVRSTAIIADFSLQSRYQNSGAFGLDAQRIVRFVHEAKNAGDISDLEGAAKSLGTSVACL